MSHIYHDEQNQQSGGPSPTNEGPQQGTEKQASDKQSQDKPELQEPQREHQEFQAVAPQEDQSQQKTDTPGSSEGRPIERKAPGRSGARGTAAMDPKTRQEVARKGGLAVSRNKQHMAEIGRKGGQSVSKNREHMAQIGRKGGAASRGHR